MLYAVFVVDYTISIVLQKRLGNLLGCALISTWLLQEKEFSSFKANREVLLQRFDKSLKEAKDESELHKKEIATLRETLFKNPSTPNQKQYEAEIWKLKQQIETLVDQNRILREQTEVLKERKDQNQSVRKRYFAMLHLFDKAVCGLCQLLI